MKCSQYSTPAKGKAASSSRGTVSAKKHRRIMSLTSPAQARTAKLRSERAQRMARHKALKAELAVNLTAIATLAAY